VSDALEQFLGPRKSVMFDTQKYMTYSVSSSNDFTEYRGLLGSACISASFTSTLYSVSARGEPFAGSPLPSTCASATVESSTGSFAVSGAGSCTGSFVGSVDDMANMRVWVWMCEDGRANE
jgi:hypothetical protein